MGEKYGGENAMQWIALIAIAIGTVATFVEKGWSAFQTASIYSNLIAAAKILYDNFEVIRKRMVALRLWWTNETMEWEVKVTYTVAEDKILNAEQIKDDLVTALQASKLDYLKGRHAEYEFNGPVSADSIALFHRALLWSVKVDIRPADPGFGFLGDCDPEQAIDIRIMAGLPYRRVADAFSDVISAFLLQVEQRTAPTDRKYVANVSASKRNPYADSFVQKTKVASIQSFSVVAALSNSTRLEVDQKRIKVISSERAEFLLNAQNILYKLA